MIYNNILNFSKMKKKKFIKHLQYSVLCKTQNNISASLFWMMVALLCKARELKNRNNEIIIISKYLKAAIGIKSKATFSELKTFGLIDVVEKPSNYHSKYKIIIPTI